MIFHEFWAKTGETKKKYAGQVGVNERLKWVYFTIFLAKLNQRKSL